SNIVKIVVTAVIIILIGVLAYLGLNKLFAKGVEAKVTTVTRISPSESNAVLTASGYVVAQRKASVASKATGRLVYLGVVEGDAVKKGQIIARLEDNDVKAALAQVKANLELNKSTLQDAKNNYERQEKLYKMGGTTQVELDAAEAAYKRNLAAIDVAKAQVQAEEVALENTLIRAPFDGTVLTKDADVGEIVSPLGASSTSRAAVVTMADMSSLQVEADVSESNIQRIKQEQDCEITLDAYPDVRYPGYVAKIVPTADRSKATVMVKIAFRKYDKKVLPEMSAKVLFLDTTAVKNNINEKPMLAVPYTAVVKKDGKSYIFKVLDNKVIEVEVKTGRESGSYIEILSGVEAGDKVIEKPTEDIKDGTEIKIL
ncbi:MAG: efflux RND transporter periplasmic adaptor subunit, partial [Ignavibacteriaceae bacterium]